MAMATARANREQAEVLSRVGQPDLSEADVRTIQDVLLTTGALAELESVIDELAHQALVALDAADITDDARKALAELAHYVAWREL
jgi:geranylgeranyl diphosphate synthase type I